MEPLSQVTGTVVPIDRENVDTDAIMPKQFLRSTSRLGYGAHLFDAWRYLDIGTLGKDPDTRVMNPEFVLNQPRYEGASILVARSNFACGSSREHAPWGLLQFGIKAILAPSYGDIFANNSLKNGLLVIRLTESEINEIFTEIADSTGFSATVNLISQTVNTSSGGRYSFEIDPFRKRCLLEGKDDIELALTFKDQIRAYERNATRARPWAFNNLSD